MTEICRLPICIFNSDLSSRAELYEQIMISFAFVQTLGCDQPEVTLARVILVLPRELLDFQVLTSGGFQAFHLCKSEL